MEKPRRRHFTTTLSAMASIFHSPFNMLDAVHWRRCKSSDDATKQFVILEKMELANHNSLLDHGQTESPIFITRSTVFPGKNSKSKPVLAVGEAISNDDSIQ